LAVRAGQLPYALKASTREPIFTRRATCFRNAAEAAARFAEDGEGQHLFALHESDVRCFEERLAAMEGGAACVGTGSGMAAILAMCMALLKAGDHIVCSDSVFGSTIALLNRYMTKFGVAVTYVRPDDNEAWRAAIRDTTRLAFLETPSNPLSAIADIRAIADICHERKVLLCVDNCFCTPALQKPFELGADLVIHSATKYLDGQGRCVGGAIVGNEELVGRDVFGFIRSAGPTMSPFNAWVFLKGLETLELRMHAHFGRSPRAGALAGGPAGSTQGALRRTGVACSARARATSAKRLRRHHRFRSRQRPGRRVVVRRCDAADVHHCEPG
jgi:O-succinylhomoserine sulfhydrylase